MKYKIFIMLFLALSVSAQSQTRTWTNVAYASISSSNKLDIDLPSTGSGPFPVIVMIHGGAFKAGDKGMEATNAKYMIKKGYAVASINYRLSGEAIFPAQIYDVKAAIRFLKANASAYMLDASRFATWGESAGGGLAALAGTSGGVTSLEDLTMGNSNQSSTVQATVDLFGPINLLTMNSQWATLGATNGQDHDAASSPESILMGGAIQTIIDACNRYNPETYITKDDPPFIIEHGSADVLIPYLQGKEFSEKLTSVIGSDKVTFNLISGAGHGTSEFFTSANLDLLAAFLDKHLVISSSDVGTSNPQAPSSFGLKQNYPNPFNPATLISFQTANTCHVSLKVFDLMGREIAELVNGTRQAGRYTIEFNASRFASGIYLCSLNAGDFSKSIKLVLIK